MTTVRSRGSLAAPVLVLAGIVLWLALAFAVGAQAPSAAGAGTAKSASAAKAKAAPKKSAATDFRLVLEPRAMAVLKAASDRLAAARSMSFTAVASYEYPSKLGPPIVYTLRYDVTMQRPDKLRVLIPGDGPASQLYYDGKSMTAYAPAENLAAIADAPPTIEAALDTAFRTAAIYFPFEDLLVADPYAALTRNTILAFDVGPSSVIGGVTTEMIVWASNEVFLQAWIGADDKLPRRLRAIFRADPLAMRHQVDFSDWKLDADVAPETFVATAAQGAGRMSFAAPAPPPRGAKPITQSKPAAASKPASTKSRSN